jgi:hypothetical protein
VHIIDDPTLLPARLAASDDMYKRFGLPPGQSGVHHKALRDLYASIPLADLDLSFIVPDPLSGAAIRLTAAADDEGNPMYVREASLAPELRPAGQHALGQNAAGSAGRAKNAAGSAGRAKPLANLFKTFDLAPRLLSELSELPQRPSTSAPGRPRAKLSHHSTTLADIKLKGLPLTTALGFDQEHKKSGESGRRYEAYKAAKTVGEYKQLNPAAFYSQKDLSFDLERGHAWLPGAGNPAAYTLAGARIAKRVQAAGLFARVDDESFATVPPPVSMASPSVDLNALFGSPASSADLYPEPSLQTLAHAGGIDLESLEGAAVTLSAEIALSETNLARFLNTAWSECESPPLPQPRPPYGLSDHVEVFVASVEPTAPPVPIRSVRQARADTARWDGPGGWKAAFEADLERTTRQLFSGRTKPTMAYVPAKEYYDVRDRGKTVTALNFVLVFKEKYNTDGTLDKRSARITVNDGASSGLKISDCWAAYYHGDPPDPDGPNGRHMYALSPSYRKNGPNSACTHQTRPPAKR